VKCAGETSHRVDLNGDWWACWQTFKDGEEILNPHHVNIEQHGDTAEIVATTCGTQSLEGGYLWRGELKLWDNEILTGGNMQLKVRSARRARCTSFSIPTAST
jgi:hypothetical protein